MYTHLPAFPVASCCLFEQLLGKVLILAHALPFRVHVAQVEQRARSGEGVTVFRLAVRVCGLPMADSLARVAVVVGITELHL